MVKEISSAVPYPTFCDAVLPRTSEASPLGLDTKAPQRANDFLIEVRAPVEDQVAGRRIVWKRFVQLLRDPGTPRMFGDVAVENLSPVVRDDKKQYSTPKANVGTPKKSIAAIASRWFFRKVAHLFAGSGSLSAFRIHLETVLSEMSKPSIVSSPCMRGAPQVRFSATMRKISSRNSLLTHFLPALLRCRDSHFQYSLNPVRCQRTTVSGCTRTNTRFHPDQSRHIRTQNNLSAIASFGSGRFSLKTVSCCRRTRLRRFFSQGDAL